MRLSLNSCQTLPGRTKIDIELMCSGDVVKDQDAGSVDFKSNHAVGGIASCNYRARALSGGVIAALVAVVEADRAGDAIDGVHVEVDRPARAASVRDVQVGRPR